MFQRGRGALSAEAFGQAMAREPNACKFLAGQFKADTASLLVALRSGQTHPLLDQAIDALFDYLGNAAKLKSRFKAMGSAGPYHVDVKGVGAVCLVSAPDFDSAGPFESVGEAEDYVCDNWSNNLVSARPVWRSPTPRPSIMAHPLPLAAAPRKELQLLDKWYSRLPSGAYFKHRAGQFSGTQTFGLGDFALHLLGRLGAADAGQAVATLCKHGWPEVSAALNDVAAVANQRRRAEVESSDLGMVREVSPFVAAWLATHAGERASYQEDLYWAMRAWINREQDASPAVPQDEDVSVRRLHFRAQQLTSIYLRHTTAPPAV